MVTALLLRHADVEGPTQDPAGPPLSAAGRARAEALVHVTGGAGITTLFASDAIRTQQTLDPLSAALGIPYTEVPSPPALAEAVEAGSLGSVILIAGHSNTVPEMVAALTGTRLPTIPAHEFDNFYVVSVTGPADGSVLRLKYGVPSS